MGTTVELSDDHVAALRALAARRGLRGLSTLLEEAIELLMEQERNDRVDAALALAGVLDEAEARVLDAHVRELRSRPARLDDSTQPVRHE